MADQRLVHVVDDEDSIRRSARFMLSRAGFAVETWETGVAFLKAVRNVEQGCVLLDVRMPEMDGLEVQQQLNEMGITMPVIILTGHGDVSIAVRAMKAGAVDFIEKPFERATLLEAVEAAHGRLEQASGGGAGLASGVDPATILAVLTNREREVLDGLAKGLPNKSIAYNLDISPRTVEVHRANLMAKLRVRSLSEALRIAFAAGMGK
jgi:two-component system, LuxR family, response regulator FixJ